MEYKKLLEEIAAYAADILKCQPICQFQYHNIEHTRSVVKNVEILGNDQGLDPETMLVLKIAAWFHDLGYVNSYDHHEDESVHMAVGFLTKKHFPEKLIKKVVDGINATRVPQNTETMVGKIMADADLFDLGTDRFFVQSKNLWNEWNKNRKSYNELEFWKMSYDFVKNHHFLTDYAIRVLEPKKKENLKKVNAMLKDLNP